MTLRTALALAAALVCAAAATTAPPAAAQVPPSAREAAAYQGLHAAAQQGDTVALARLLAARADVHARDAHGRTPLHVATFARQHEAIRQLARAGADLNALEADRYDAVTMAAVADDEATLRLLLQLGASARQVTSRYDGTALIAAAHLGHDGVVRQLMAAGAPPGHAAGPAGRGREPPPDRPAGQHSAATGPPARLCRHGAAAGGRGGALSQPGHTLPFAIFLIAARA